MRHAPRWLIATTVVFACALPGARPAAEEIAVGAGESVQAAVDKAPEGATIRLAAGVFPEGVTITKPLTLQGAGWEKTTLGPDKRMPLTQKQKDEFSAALKAASNPQERAKIAIALGTGQSAPTVTVKNTKGVVLRGIRFRGPPNGEAEGGITAEALVTFDNAAGAIRECAVIGPFMNGVAVLAGSDVEIGNSLVAAMWGTGVVAGRRTKLHMGDSDVRNCYLRCVTLGTDDATIERCRISGSAWHGVRYDDCSPKVLSNHSPKPMQDGEAAKPLPPGNESSDPKLSGAADSFKLAADSPARQANAGAADPIAFASPFAIQPEEMSMVPDSETRESSKWKKVAVGATSPR